MTNAQLPIHAFLLNGLHALSCSACNGSSRLRRQPWRHEAKDASQEASAIQDQCWRPSMRGLWGSKGLVVPGVRCSTACCSSKGQPAPVLHATEETCPYGC